jgi:hypothetical protein
LKSARLNSEKILRTEDDRLSTMIPDRAPIGRHPRERGIIPGFPIELLHCFLSLHVPDFGLQITNG